MKSMETSPFQMSWNKHWSPNSKSLVSNGNSFLIPNSPTARIENKFKSSTSAWDEPCLHRHRTACWQRPYVRVGRTRSDPRSLSVPTFAWDEPFLFETIDLNSQRPYVRVGRTSRWRMRSCHRTASLRPRGTNHQTSDGGRKHVSVPTSAWDEH